MTAIDLYAEDRTDLRAVIATVLERHPGARAVSFETSCDAPGFGFELTDVTLADETALWDTDEGLTVATLNEDVSGELCNLRWRGILAEDKRGYTTLPTDVAVDELPRVRQLAAA